VTRAHAGSRAVCGARVLAACLVLLGLAAAARAQPAAGGPRYWLERYERDTVVQADGTFVETIRDEIAFAAGEAAASPGGDSVQRVLEWNASQGWIEIVAAATLKRDGSRIPAPAELASEVAVPGPAGLERGQRARVITFVDVAPGDRIVLEARHHRTVAAFPGQFFDLQVMPEVPVHRVRIAYDLPESMPLAHDAAGGLALAGTERAGGRVRREWRGEWPAPRVDEYRAVAASDYAGRLAVSTFTDYPALAHAFREGAGTAAQPTTRLRALARQVTAGARTPRERAARLHRWVREHLRFGGVHEGRASVVPAAAELTLERGEGDCKDLAMLYEALLASVGIGSTAAFVNAGDAYRLPAAPGLGVFDHVMTWIPALHTWVDCTARHTPFGELPTTVSDKPAMLVSTGELVRTPTQKPLHESIVLEARVQASGRTRLRLDDTAPGWFAGARRRLFDTAVPESLDAIAQAMLAQAEGRGSARLVRIGGDDEPAPVRLRFDADASGLVRDAGDGPVLPARSSMGLGIVPALADFGPQHAHTVPSVCVPAHVDELGRWRLPAGWSAAALPGDAWIDGEGFRYSATYRASGRTIVIRRSLRLDFASNACSPERVRIVQRLAARVAADQDGTVRLRRGLSR
jgi:transglutaminase-like putative cysteine protease